MGSLLGECSVMQEITKTEEAIKTCYDRIEILEERMESDRGMSEKRKTNLKTELAEMRKLLETNKLQLSQLHKHNRKSFIFVAALCFVCFTVYALYILVQGKDF